VLCIPPFVLDDVRNLNEPELTQSRSNTHRYLPENKKTSDTHPVPISSICEKKRGKTTTVLCIPPFVPDDVGNLDDPEAHREQIEHSSISPEN